MFKGLDRDFDNVIKRVLTTRCLEGFSGDQWLSGTFQLTNSKCVVKDAGEPMKHDFSMGNFRKYQEACKTLK